MNFCRKCGRPRGGAARFCAGCGTPLDGAPSGAPATTEQAQPVTVPAQWPASVPPQPGETAPLDIAAVRDDLGVGDPAAGVPFRNQGSVPRRARADKAGLMLAGAMAVLVAGGTGVWAVTRHAGQAGHPAAGHAANPAPSTPARPEPTAAPAGDNLVMIAPGVAQGGAEPAVVAFLDDYFAAINDHDFPQYRSLLGAPLRKDETAADFRAGYRTTADSGATLVGLAPGSGQAVAATITFTSHQSAADSPTRTTCTTWQTTLYLRPKGQSYVIEEPPASYRAIYRAC